MVNSVSRREAALEGWLLLFFLFSTAGWIWEVLLTVFCTGQWVNRGMLYGPWLPIYGVGGVLLAALTDRFRLRWTAPVLGALAGGALEYGTALALEHRFQQRWWDYSGMPGSIHGRVCLASLLGFALAGGALVWLTPWLRARADGLDGGVRTALCRIISLLYALDWARALLLPNTGAGITCLL